MKTEMVHRACGKVGIYYAHRPAPGEELQPELILDQSGKRMRKGGAIRCLNCSAIILPHFFALGKCVYVKENAASKQELSGAGNT